MAFSSLVRNKARKNLYRIGQSSSYQVISQHSQPWKPRISFTQCGEIFSELKWNLGSDSKNAVSQLEMQISRSSMEVGSRYKKASSVNNLIFLQGEKNSYITLTRTNSLSQEWPSCWKTVFSNTRSKMNACSIVLSPFKTSIRRAFCNHVTNKVTFSPVNHAHMNKIWVTKLLSRGISMDSITSRMKISPDVVKKPLEGLKTSASRYREVAGLQVEAFWKRNVMILVGAAGVLSCFLLWQLMYGVANMFVSFSEGMAKFGFLAMAAATVSFTAMALRARYTINPDKVYRIVMRTLNTSAPALEVLGPPLTGTDLRAYVMSGGGLKLKNFKPMLGSRRCFLLFPIHGAERKGLVSVEVKKKNGKYDFKLLAIDVAIPGAEQRIYIVGDESEYNVGGGLIGQLRDPIFKAMAAQGEFDAQDEKEQQEEAKAEEERRAQEIRDKEAQRNEEIARLERES